jgi:hypothetical protein
MIKIPALVNHATLSSSDNFEEFCLVISLHFSIITFIAVERNNNPLLSNTATVIHTTILKSKHMKG